MVQILANRDDTGFDLLPALITLVLFRAGRCRREKTEILVLTQQPGKLGHENREICALG